MLGANQLTIKRWEREGVLPASIKIGNRRVYPLEKIQRLIEECGRYGPPYPDPDRPGVWRVPLRGCGIQRREALIDEQDLAMVKQHHWYFSISNNGSPGFVSLSEAFRATPMRRVILGITDPRLGISHRNGDPLDCRRENLVVRTMEQLARANRKMGCVNGHEYTSRFKGVCWDKRNKKWLVQIRKGDIQRKIGRFQEEITAAEKYDQAARELFGEDAFLNFPNGVDAWLEQQAKRSEQEQQREAA